MMEGGDFSMWQQQGSETGMSLVPLKIVLALLILGVGVLMYGSHCQWRHAAEDAAMAGAERLAAAKYGDMVVHLEPTPEWGDALSGRMEAALGESVHFQTNFQREKRQQQAKIAGEEVGKFHASSGENMELSWEEVQQAEREASFCAGELCTGMQSAWAGRRAFVTLGEEGEKSQAVTDEIDCYAYAVKLERALPLPAFLVEKSLKLEYTALATVTVRYNLWK